MCQIQNMQRASKKGYLCKYYCVKGNKEWLLSFLSFIFEQASKFFKFIYYRHSRRTDNAVWRIGSGKAGEKFDSFSGITNHPGSPGYDPGIWACLSGRVSIQGVKSLWGDCVDFPRLGTGDTDRWRINLLLCVTCQCPWCPISEKRCNCPKVI